MACVKQQRADGSSAFPTLWGTPWDGHCLHLHTQLNKNTLVWIIVLTLPEDDRICAPVQLDRVRGLGGGDDPATTGRFSRDGRAD